MFQIMMSLLLQASLFSLALASDTITTSGHGNAWKFGTGGGVVGFIILILDIVVFVELFQSSRPASHKLLWALVVFFFPILGIILYWLLSNRTQHNAGGGGYQEIA